MKALFFVLYMLPSISLSASFDGNNFEKNLAMRSWSEIKNQNLILQTLDLSCGPAALATILNYFYGKNTSEKDVIEFVGKSDSTTSFEDLSRYASQNGFQATGIELDFEQLKKLRIPIILFTLSKNSPHFVVLKGVSDDLFFIGDPLKGNYYVSSEKLKAIWLTKRHTKPTGLALVVLPSDKTLLGLAKDKFSSIDSVGYTSSLISSFRKSINLQ